MEMSNEEKKNQEVAKKYGIVLFNDPIHSLEYVVEVLSNCIPEMDETKATKAAYNIHRFQKTLIYKGELEHTEHFIDLIENYEPEVKDGKLLPPLAVDIK